MERVKIFNLITLAVTFLALVPKMESQIRSPAVTPRPLCASQYALANYACARLPFTPWSPPEPLPSPPPSPDDDEGHKNHHHRHQGHKHGHRHRHHQTAEEEDCCRWAREVDSQCVCELLAHLPPFLMKPLHQYSLHIGEDCDVTYSCGAPI